MLVAGVMVVIVSLVLFRQISDQLLSAKTRAAVDQSLSGVQYARSEVRAFVILKGRERRGQPVN